MHNVIGQRKKKCTQSWCCSHYNAVKWYFDAQAPIRMPCGCQSATHSHIWPLQHCFFFIFLLRWLIILTYKIAKSGKKHVW